MVYLEPPIPAERSNEILNCLLPPKIMTADLDVDTVRKSRYSDNQIYEENEHYCYGSFAQFCRLR